MTQIGFIPFKAKVTCALCKQWGGNRQIPLSEVCESSPQICWSIFYRINVPCHYVSYMALFVQLVVGELELVEVDDHVHPVRAKSRGIGVYVQPCRRALFFKAFHPG